jgi:DNA-binding LytR/AlgR family response regulator
MLVKEFMQSEIKVGATFQVHLVRQPSQERQAVVTRVLSNREEGLVRIHSSVVVNSSFVEEIRPLLTGECFLQVQGGEEYTVTSLHVALLVQKP